MTDPYGPIPGGSLASGDRERSRRECGVMDRNELINRLCALRAEVMRRQFKYHAVTDCMCQPRENWQDDGLVLTFIEETVRAALPPKPGA